MLKRIALNSQWGFLIDPFNRGLTWAKYHEPRPANAGDLHRDAGDLLLRQVPVPGCWQLYGTEYTWYDGTAFFFRRFPAPRLSRGERAFLRLGAVSFRAQAWLNGRALGGIDFPYLPWEAEITGLLRAENLLVVRVEGAPTPEDCVPTFGWRNFAGLLRPVDIRITGPQRFSNLFADPELRLESSEGRLALRLRRDSADPACPAARVAWSLADGDRLLAEGESPWHVGARQWRGMTAWRPVQFWAPGRPKLYRLTVELRDGRGVMDRLEQAIGFREYRCVKDGFTLNGRPIRLRGVSRHDLDPAEGMALSGASIRRDLDLIEELGCNAVRLAHMPNDERVLAECDRRGLLAWVEIPVYWNADFGKAVVRRRMLAQMEALLRRDYNHPSVAIWSVANEVPSDRASCSRAICDAVRRVKRLDPVRPVTFATWPLAPEKNLALRAVDFLSLNQYRGWYKRGIPPLAGELRALARLGKPVVLSEFGAGAVAGRHGPARLPWTEEYQAQVLRRNLDVVRRHAAGCFVWLLADFPDPSRVHSRITDGFINNKGLLSEDRRRRKKGFFTVQQCFQQWQEEERQRL